MARSSGFPLAILLALATTSVPAAGPAAEARARRAPILTTLGPFGDPLSLAVPAPRVASAWRGLFAELPFEPAQAAPKPSRGVPLEIAAPLRFPSSGEPDQEIKDRDAEGALPVEPGTLRQGPIRVPSAHFKNQLVTPRLTPDVKLIETGSATVGMFGEVGRVDIDRTGTLPTVKAHDLGGGLTLRYKFGQ